MVDLPPGAQQPQRPPWELELRRRPARLPRQPPRQTRRRHGQLQPHFSRVLAERRVAGVPVLRAGHDRDARRNDVEPGQPVRRLRHLNGRAEWGEDPVRPARGDGDVGRHGDRVQRRGQAEEGHGQDPHPPIQLHGGCLWGCGVVAGEFGGEGVSLFGGFAYVWRHAG